jgi:hypothetical protein
MRHKENDAMAVKVRAKHAKGWPIVDIMIFYDLKQSQVQAILDANQPPKTTKDKTNERPIHKSR